MLGLTAWGHWQIQSYCNSSDRETNGSQNILLQTLSLESCDAMKSRPLIPQDKIARETEHCAGLCKYSSMSISKSNISGKDRI